MDEIVNHISTLTGNCNRVANSIRENTTMVSFLVDVVYNRKKDATETDKKLKCLYVLFVGQQILLLGIIIWRKCF